MRLEAGKVTFLNCMTRFPFAKEIFAVMPLYPSDLFSRFDGRWLYDDRRQNQSRSRHSMANNFYHFELMFTNSYLCPCLGFFRKQLVQEFIQRHMVWSWQSNAIGIEYMFDSCGAF